MSQSISISVFEAVGSPLCVASEDGKKVYSRLTSAIKQNRSVSLSFRNVSMLTSAFLNTAVGQLYGEFNEKQIRALLKVEDMEADDLALLKRVAETAKLYFQDAQRFKEPLNESISVFKVVGRSLCVASEDGKKVYSRLAAAIKQNRSVWLSFRNVSNLSSAFLNAAVGRLYGEFDEKQIRALLKVEDMEADDLALLKRVVETAKLYFQDPQRFNEIVLKEFEDDDGTV